MALIVGSQAGEPLNGTNQSDLIFAFGGNDTVNGNNGADVIFAGSGNDTASGQNGNDTISGDAGNDNLNGNNGDDVLAGNEGSDVLTGGNGADVMSGGSGDDTLWLDKDDRFASGDDGLDTASLTGSGTFNLRGELAGLETLIQGSGNAALSLDDLLFTTVEGNKVTIDLDGGNNDTVNIYYNGSVLDFDKGNSEAGEVIFGPAGGVLNKSIDFDNVEHLNFFNTATGASGTFDHWL